MRHTKQRGGVPSDPCCAAVEQCSDPSASHAHLTPRPPRRPPKHHAGLAHPLTPLQPLADPQTHARRGRKVITTKVTGDTTTSSTRRPTLALPSSPHPPLCLPCALPTHPNPNYTHVHGEDEKLYLVDTWALPNGFMAQCSSGHSEDQTPNVNTERRGCACRQQRAAAVRCGAWLAGLDAEVKRTCCRLPIVW